MDGDQTQDLFFIRTYHQELNRRTLQYPKYWCAQNLCNTNGVGRNKVCVKSNIHGQAQKVVFGIYVRLRYFSCRFN